MGVFDLFKKKEIPNGPIPGTLFCHEDDYCMVELMPVENLDWLKEELDEPNEFAEKHFEGYVWTTKPVTKENAVKLYSRKIDPDSLFKIMDRTGFALAPAVTTGYGQTVREDCPNTFGFGHDYSAVYFSTMFESVDEIWFTNLFALEREKVIDMLHDMGKTWNLVLFDWFKRQIVSLAYKEAIKNYFEQEV